MSLAKKYTELAEKIYWILIEEAQHDMNRKLGELIVMTPSEVLDIIRKHEAELETSVGQIVRCKDCKWWDKDSKSDYGYCHACKHGYRSENWEIDIYRRYKGDWFCAEGERRDE